MRCTHRQRVEESSGQTDEASKQTAIVKVCGQTGRKLWQSLPISGGTLTLLACVMKLSNTHMHVHTEAQQYSGLNINHRG